MTEYQHISRIVIRRRTYRIFDKIPSMKVFLLLLFFSTAIYSQNIDMPQNEVLNLLCRKWTISFSKTDGHIERDFPRLKNYYTEFMADGSVTLNRNGKIVKGYWEYDKLHKHVTFKTFDDSLVITNLTEKEMLIVMPKDRAKLKDGQRPEDNYGYYVPIN